MAGDRPAIALRPVDYVLDRGTPPRRADHRSGPRSAATVPPPAFRPGGRRLLVVMRMRVRRGLDLFVGGRLIDPVTGDVVWAQADDPD